MTDHGFSQPVDTSVTSSAPSSLRGGRFAHARIGLAVLAVLTVAMAIIALGVGRYPVSFGDCVAILFAQAFGVAADFADVAVNTVMNTRLPRILAALLIGAALAESGAAYQGIFKNPMVSPDILGVSSGACVGAALGILLDWGSIGIQTERLAFCAPIIVISGAVLFFLRWRINVLSLPDAQSYYLGTNVRRLRWLVILCSTLMTASAVCLSGTIGWIGLVVPHMSRLLVGTDNRFVIPASILFGGLFLLLADTLARTISTMSIPISVITGIVGAPLFVVLLLKQGRAIR